MDTTTIVLDEPIQRGETKIERIDLRRPKAGELRGVSLTDLLQMDVGALIKVLPRISTPPLTDADVSAMDTADLVQCGGVVAGFLLPRATMLAVATSPSQLQ